MAMEDTNKELPREKKRKLISLPLALNDVCQAVTSSGSTKLKCSICTTALARKSCSQIACIRCCTDMKCEGHREQREKESIMNGTHPINQLANAKRSLAIKPGLFKDPAFRYLGETILIWSLEEYMSNVKWREDAIRKSLRNLESRKQDMFVENLSQFRKRQKKVCERQGHNIVRTDFCSSNELSKESRRKRFIRVMNELYEKTLIEA